MNYKGEERRRYPRALFPCKIRIVTQGRLLVSHTENISRGGIRVILEENLKYFPVIGIDLMIAKNKEIQCEGRVVWVKEKVSPVDKEPIMFDTGIEFTTISDSDKKNIECMVDTISNNKNNLEKNNK